MAEMPFMPLATDAYLADTSHLSDAEHGRYLLLMIALWRAPTQRLPNDDEWLARKFNRDVEHVASELRPIIVEFCQCDGNWITQKRLSKEYLRAKKAVNQRRDAANTRWLKEKQQSERTAASYGSRNAPTLIPTPTSYSLTSNSTDAARGAALRKGYAPRAKGQSVKERVAELARLNRSKIAGNA